MHFLSRAGKSRATMRLTSDRSLCLLAGACGLIVVSFYAPFLWMRNQWLVVEEYSPGPAVPIMSAIALWHMLKKEGSLSQAARICILTTAFLAGIVWFGKDFRQLLPGASFFSSGCYLMLFPVMTFTLLSSGFLLARAASGDHRRRAGTLGLLLLLLSLAVHFLAVRGDFPRASIVAYVTLLFGVSWYLHGWRTVKRLAFPYAILVLMAPLEFIDEIVGVPLRLMATDVAVFLMRLAGIHVEQTGNWFAIGSMQFSVNAPCSGLKSLIALTALGATFAYVTQPTVLKKILLASCAVPIAILTNIIRLACVGISAELVGKKFAVSVFHDNAAIFLYVFAIFIFISLDKRVFQAKWFKVKNF